MSYPDELMTRLRAGDPEMDDRRAARVEHLEEFVWRGDYQIPATEIVAALLRDAALSRANFASPPSAAPGSDGIFAIMGT